jgi:ferric-dicitrate binding protein FerR (iron transport regulator)
VTFAGPERKIELKGGEAYFDIAHDASKPFKVILNGIEVEVLGTQFGISAFPGEDRVKTSLITGKVKISSAAAGSKILAPGQAANVDGNGTITIEKDANVEGSIAWVHGYFHFEEADMAAVLRQLARWYDVDVVYHGKISNEKLQGDVERNIPLSKVLSNLEIIGKVRFKIEGRTIIVNP